MGDKDLRNLELMKFMKALEGSVVVISLKSGSGAVGGVLKSCNSKGLILRNRRGFLRFVSYDSIGYIKVKVDSCRS